jgi:hypothetical protein
LTELALNDEHRQTRRAATEAQMQIDPQAAAAMSWKTPTRRRFTSC